MGRWTVPLPARDGMRLAFGMAFALPTTMAFLGLSAAVLVGRCLTALAARRMALAR